MNLQSTNQNKTIHHKPNWTSNLNFKTHSLNWTIQQYLVRVFELLFNFKNLLRFVIEQATVRIYFLAVAIAVERLRRRRGSIGGGAAVVRLLAFRARAGAGLFLELVAVEAVSVVAIPAGRRRRRGGVETLDDAITAALQLSGGVSRSYGDCGVDEHPHVDARRIQYGSEIVQIHIRSASVRGPKKRFQKWFNQKKKRLRRCVLKKSSFSLFKNGEKRIWEDSLLGSNLLKTETARCGSKRRGKRRSEIWRLGMRMRK